MAVPRRHTHLYPNKKVSILNIIRTKTYIPRYHLNWLIYIINPLKYLLIFIAPRFPSIVLNSRLSPFLNRFKLNIYLLLLFNAITIVIFNKLHINYTDSNYYCKVFLLSIAYIILSTKYIFLIYFLKLNPKIAINTIFIFFIKESVIIISPTKL